MQSAAFPSYVTDLQAAYGPPSQAGFGSAVFYDTVDSSESLEAAALKHYRYFVGDLWERWGEAAWMAPWKPVYRKQPGATHDIVAEMHSVTDPDAALLLSTLLTSGDDLAAAHGALSKAYNDEAIADLVIYAIGDSGAMSGVLVAGRRETNDTVFLIFLLD